MIDEKALEKALRTYDDYWANADTPGEALRCAIEAYLAAAPLPGAGDPVAWRTDWHDGIWRYSDDKDHVDFVREDGGIVQPLYTAAPVTAQTN